MCFSGSLSGCEDIQSRYVSERKRRGNNSQQSFPDENVRMPEKQVDHLDPVKRHSSRKYSSIQQAACITCVNSKLKYFTPKCQQSVQRSLSQTFVQVRIRRHPYACLSPLAVARFTKIVPSLQSSWTWRGNAESQQAFQRQPKLTASIDSWSRVNLRADICTHVHRSWSHTHPPLRYYLVFLTFCPSQATCTPNVTLQIGRAHV